MHLKPVAFFLLCISLFTSCKRKEIIEVDGDLYSVAFKGFNLSDTLRNTVSAEIICQDSVGTTAKIDVYAGDSLIATSTGSRLLLSWNTLTMKDDRYSVRIVATDKSGNQKELTKTVVLSNALVTIEKEILIGLFSQTADYVITDAQGQILNTTHLKKGMDNSTLSLYPAAAFDGNEIHVIRTLKGSSTDVECLMNVKRGVVLKSPAVRGQLKYPEIKTAPIPFQLNNIPAHTLVTVSTDKLYPYHPFENRGEHIIYSPDSKVLVQVEWNDKALYHLFDIPAGSSSLSLDASLCKTPSLSKTIHVPFPFEWAVVNVYGKPYPGYSERYMFTQRRVYSDQVQVFFPGNFFYQMEANIHYKKDNLKYSHHYADHIPENVREMNVSAEVRNRTLSNSEFNLAGDFDHYRAVFYNLKPGEPYKTGTPIINVYGSKYDPKFKFPDVMKAAGLSEYPMESFNLSNLILYRYDKPSAKARMFNSLGNYLWGEGGNEISTAELSFN